MEESMNQYSNEVPPFGGCEPTELEGPRRDDPVVRVVDGYGEEAGDITVDVVDDYGFMVAFADRRLVVSEVEDEARHPGRVDA
jgi:hypothetical protein